MPHAVKSSTASHQAAFRQCDDACALEARARQRSLCAELTLRKAYAEGSGVQREINLLTHRVLRKGPTLQLLSHDRACRRFSEVNLDDAVAAQDFFQGTLGSRMTAMDIFDLADIASPILHPTSVAIEHSAEDDEHHLTLRMDYASDRFYDVGIERTLSLSVEGGRVGIEQNDIRLTPGTRGLGIGARFMLSTALFARRHAIAGWEEDLQDDGPLVWPWLGARITEDTVASLRARLQKLFASGILPEGLSFPERFVEIAAFTLRWSDIEDRSAFHAWLMREACVSCAKMETLSLHAIPVGALLLRVCRISGEFNTQRILETLLEKRLPHSIEQKGAIDTRDGVLMAGKKADALGGLRQSYHRGLLEYCLPAGSQLLQPQGLATSDLNASAAISNLSPQLTSAALSLITMLPTGLNG
jgi:hypothetical protein